MLDTIVDTSRRQSADARRSGRFAARHTLWDESSLERVRNCGRARQDSTQGVAVKVTTADDGTRAAGYSNIQSCGSVWACPVCSAKIAAHRQREITRAIEVWTGRGGKVALGSFTMRHSKGQRLKTLWDGQSDAWHATASGGGWTKDKMKYGESYMRLVTRGKHKGSLVADWRIPMVRVFETTVGDLNGWHTHVHCVVFLPGTATAAGARDLGARMFERWRGSLVRSGFAAPSMRRGWDMRLIEGDASEALGEYFTKSVYSHTPESAGLEVARGDMKEGRWGNRTPFQVLRSIVVDGDADDLETWHEWERGSKGRRQIAWTAGFREEMLSEPELDDQSIAEQEAGGEVEMDIDPDLWVAVHSARKDYAVLRAFESSTRAGLELLMTLSGLADTATDERTAPLMEWGRARAGWRQRS